MVRQTFVNPHFVIRCDDSGCSVWTRTGAKGNAVMAMYRFEGCEDVEDTRTVQETADDPKLAQLYRYQGSEGKNVELYRFNLDYRRREAAFLSAHGLWSWADTAHRTIICGGISQFVNHHCNRARVQIIRPPGQWQLEFKPSKFPKASQEVFLSYSQTQDRLVSILHGRCQCDQCQSLYGLDATRIDRMNDLTLPAAKTDIARPVRKRKA
jgi:hypothetical protein